LTRFASGRPLLGVLFVLTLPLVTAKVRGADEIEYFSYLRSFVIDGDLEFGNEYQHFYDADPDGLAGFKATFLDLREPRTGRHINFAPLGSALLWSPFYFATHLGVLLARTVGVRVAADGFSWPYVAAVCYGSALYGLAGLLLLHDALRRFGRFAEPGASWAVAALWVGSPVLFYMTLAPAFSHAASLFVVSLLLWLSLRAHAHGTGLWDAAAIGSVGGLAGLVREQDVLFLSVPAVLLSFDLLKARRVFTLVGRLLAMAAGAALMFVPQLLAYRYLNGRFAPSTMVGRKLVWWSPHFLDVLFDPGHGLFLWSPLLLVSVVALFPDLATRRIIPAALLLALLLQVWINGSLESWTQAGAFGSRRFVSSTPVFAWGLAALVTAAIERMPALPVPAALIVFAWWNVSLMVQFGLRLMDRQKLEWPRVAVNQLTEVPPRLGHVAAAFLTDRERLAREAR
jgi:hypothetical protein